MKFSTTLMTGLLGFGLLAAASADTPAGQNPVKFELPKVGSDTAQAPAPAAPASAPAMPAPAPAAPKFTEAQLMETYGFIAGMRLGLAELELTPEQVDAVSRGLAHAARGEKASPEMQASVGQLQEFMSKKQQAFMAKVRNHNLAESNAFFARLDADKNVQKLPDGLRYEVIRAGTGASPKTGQIAKIHYKGTFISGQEFDNDAQHGPAAELPVQIATQENQGQGVIPGMAEGLQKMSVGGKYKLYIPPHLAYGDEGTQGIAPASTLVFEIEVLEVKDAPAAPAAPMGK
jgi:FKBP-type peptidyl-prolyl cis-trans isomerase